MKKTIISILGVATLMLSMTSCGESIDGPALAKEVCECTTKSNALPASDPNRSAEQDKCTELNVSNWDKIKGDMEQEDAFNAEFPCGF